MRNEVININQISFLEKFEVKFTLYRLKKLGVQPKRYLIFDPELLFLDLINDDLKSINKTVLNKVIHQIKKHLNLDVEFSIKVNYYQHDFLWKPYPKNSKPITIFDDKIYINLFLSIANHLNIDSLDFHAILCKEITRYYLEKNNIKLKDEYYVEMAMCSLGIFKETYLQTIGTDYYHNNEILTQSFFVASQSELSYAKYLCEKNSGVNFTERENINRYTENDMFLVCIFDSNTHIVRKEKRKIDTTKFPPVKFAVNDTYYAIETLKDNKKVRMYCTKNNWNKQIESGISE